MSGAGLGVTGSKPEPAAPGREAAARAIGWYYLGTIGFLLLDLLFGFNVRVAAFESSPALKYTYYAGLIGCGAMVRLRPERAAVTALVESSANLALLLGSIMLTYYGVIDAALAGSFDTTPFTPESIINAGVSGLALVGGIYSNPLMQPPTARLRGSPGKTGD